MPITEQDINKLTELAKLDLSDNDFKKSLISDLNNILNLFKVLESTDTTNVTPLIHADNCVKQRLRLDEVTEINNREHLQAIAPLNGTESGLYLVPKVIETE